MARFDAKEKDTEFKEHIVAINRVSKTVKGGRIFKFAALVVVATVKAPWASGLGKAGEVPDAIRKGIEDAKKHLVKVSLKGSTIPHEVIGAFGAGRVLMKPAAPGTGVIAGGAVRAVVEAAGIRISVPRLSVPTIPATWSAPPWTACASFAPQRKRRPCAAGPPRKS